MGTLVGKKLASVVLEMDDKMKELEEFQEIRLSLTKDEVLDVFNWMQINLHANTAEVKLLSTPRISYIVIKGSRSQVKSVLDSLGNWLKRA